MKLYKLLLSALALFIFSCNNKPVSTLNNILNENQLTSQLFYVNINADTTLITAQGCIIKIPKQSLESDSSNVKLEIKEALTIEQIVLAGLTTMSGKQALSSGGMIYFNAANGYKVKIKNQLEVLVPTKTYNPDMKVYKGEKEKNGKINWKDPQPLPEDETILKIDQGEALFKANCTNCHKIYQDFTAPALYGITDRRPKEWIYAFTRNSQALIEGTNQAPGTRPAYKEAQPLDSTHSGEFYHPKPDYYSICLFNKWDKTVMTAFPVLDDSALDALYTYIKTESDKRPDLSTQFGPTCCDSCAKASDMLYELEKTKQVLLSSNEKFFSINRTINISPAPDTSPVVVSNIAAPVTNSSEKNKVSPTQINGTFYTINIDAPGWYNIDILTKEISNCIPSELFVKINGSDKPMNVVLIIPSLKAFIEGGKLEDKKQYGFDDADGQVPLPQNTQCYIMAFAESGQKVLFSKTYFISKQKQTIELALSEVTKDEMASQIKMLNLNDINISTQKTIIPAQIQLVDDQIKEVLKLEPKTCGCGFER